MRFFERIAFGLGVDPAAAAGTAMQSMICVSPAFSNPVLDAKNPWPRRC
jgi:hypothetical protein